MPFLSKYKFLNIGITICIIIIFCFSFIPTILTSSASLQGIQIFSLVLLAYLLITWWRKRITQTYIERIRSAELESLRKENEEKDLRIKELMDNNNHLASIIHKATAALSFPQRKISL